jgi:hypothetical protein
VEGVRSHRGRPRGGGDRRGRASGRRVRGDVGALSVGGGLLTEDLASLTVHLRFPSEHWRRIRHSNFIERTFEETRRRVKVIGRLPGEHSCLSLVWAVLDRASRGWRGVTQTPAGLRLLQDLRRGLLDPPREKEVSDAAVTPAA